MDEMMQAVVIHAYGGPDGVRLDSVPRPVLGEGEVLVRVEAAGVNPIDWKIRNGAGGRLGHTLPIHMGGECVGIVEAGGEAGGFAAGERVFGMVHTGAFAEWVAAPAAAFARVPAGLDPVEAAALPLAGTTAWQALFSVVGLQAGQRVLITNSSGGVGSLALQFAKACGAHVTAVTSGRNAAFVRSLGADEVIDYTTQAFDEVASGIDVVLDTQGGEAFARAFSPLKAGGVMVTVVAFPADEAERYGVRVERSFTRPDGGALAEMAALVAEGRVRLHVDRALPLSEIGEALALSESGRARGKIVMTMMG